jgi:hypothetical protein
MQDVKSAYMLLTAFHDRYAAFLRAVSVLLCKEHFSAPLPDEPYYWTDLKLSGAERWCPRYVLHSWVPTGELGGRSATSLTGKTWPSRFLGAMLAFHLDEAIAPEVWLLVIDEFEATSDLTPYKVQHAVYSLVNADAKRQPKSQVWYPVDELTGHKVKFSYSLRRLPLELIEGSTSKAEVVSELNRLVVKPLKERFEEPKQKSSP